MPTLSASLPTMIDFAKRLDPNGQIAVIAELLSKMNPILKDIPWKEGNLAVGHQVSVRTGLPSVFWRLLNQGIQPSKSTTAQIMEACGMLEALSSVDVDLAKLESDVGAFRLSEAKAFLAALANEMASTMFYGNSGTDPEQFNGLSIRYSDSTTANARNIVNGGAANGQTDCSSIWCVVWSEETAFGVYPKGSSIGLERKDYGEQMATITAGVGATVMRVLQEWFQWKAGLVIKDWRFVSRVCNLDLSLNNADYIVLMIKMLNRIESLEMGTPVIYMNRTISERLELLALTNVRNSAGLTFDSVDGKRIASFQGVPIRVCDALLNSETAVNF